MILAGDIGGTKTDLALFDAGLKELARGQWLNRDYDGLDTVVRVFLEQERAEVTDACFGIAGVVEQGRVRMTNLSWVVDAGAMASVLHIPSVRLLNDLEAIAYGVAALDQTDFLVLNDGVAGATGNAAVIAAGTGLGEAGLYWDGTRHHPFASEGGHTSFAPRNELEIELLRYLLKQFDHVSYERVVSGPGLVNIYRFLRDTGRGEEPSWLSESIAHSDPAAAISRAALERASPLCMQAEHLFVSLYGAEAANLALKTMALAGVYVAGGIARKITTKLADGTFRDAFLAKGRRRELLQRIPVRVVLNDKVALRGAARCAVLARAGHV